MPVRFVYPVFVRLIVLIALFCTQTRLFAEEAPIEHAVPSLEALRERAKIMQETANTQLKEGEIACYQKILVNACLSEAKQTHIEEIKKVRSVEEQIRTLEEKNRRSALEAKTQEQGEKEEKRQVEQEKSAQQFRQNEAEKAAQRSEKQANKAKQAEAARKKREEENAARQLKNEERARKNAAKKT